MTVTTLGQGLYGPGFQLDPHPALATARVKSPLIRIRHPLLDVECWLALRYSAVRALLADNRIVKPVEPGEPSSLNSSPPEHTRLRGLVQLAFTRHRVKALTPRIRALTNELLDPILARGEGELVQELTNPLPMRVNCEMLGLPRSEWDEVTRCTKGFVDGEDTDRIREAFQLTNDYVVDLVAGNHARSGDDLISALIDAREGTDRLSEDELVRMLMSLLVNGYVSTALALANAVHSLTTHPDQWALLRSRPELIDSAVDELLRFEPPVSAVTWTAAESLVVEGIPIQAGDLVITSFQAANRDPDRFTQPDRLDVTRSPNPHVTFSHGIHRCLGASLARLETTIVLETLVNRCPDLHLAGPARRHDAQIVRGLAALPITTHQGTGRAAGRTNEGEL
ncbi:cytochrome P450 [Nocardia sp. NPDC046473]|uniref:cytochrome P450 family protein n=1 Tax=Nocardia sp. NPDC046473 TaxID=3155733 RepID=UPI0033E17A7F